MPAAWPGRRTAATFVTAGTLCATTLSAERSRTMNSTNIWDIVVIIAALIFGFIWRDQFTMFQIGMIAASVLTVGVIYFWIFKKVQEEG